MKSAPVRHRRQRGAALIVMAFILVLGMSWMVVSRLGAAGSRTAADRAHNGNVLNHAKLALIGWVAQRAALATEDNPGRLPCPEAPGYYGDPGQEGIAAGNCTLPAVGRLPWRTLGLEKLRDASGEPLWYVVSAGWALSNSTTPPLTTYINSDSPGQLVVDAQANAAVALIIAPGAALQVAASANCAARSQSRTASPPDLRDYLECENATSPADASFATAGPSGSFNDQVLRVTTADLLPGIEAAISKRIESEVAPRLMKVYSTIGESGADWGISDANNKVLPFAASFTNPSNASYAGVAGTFEGLLPFSHSTTGCNPVTDSRCQPNLIAWNSTAPYSPNISKQGGTGNFVGGSSCTIVGTSYANCEGEYDGGPMNLRFKSTLDGAAMAFKQMNAARVETWALISGIWQLQTGSTAKADFNADGSVTIQVDGGVPTGGTNYRQRTYRTVLEDHPVLSATDPSPCVSTGCTAWFVRNEWYRLLYYTVAPGHAASGTAPRSCSDSATPATCLTVTGTLSTSKPRALLILVGRSLNGSARPSAVLANYLDSVENSNSDTTFEQLRVGKTFNDRVIVVDANP